MVDGRWRPLGLFRSAAAVDGAFVEVVDLNIDVMLERFFDVGLAEVVVVFHRRDRAAAGAVDAW
jgi:hypothetical protein